MESKKNIYTVYFSLVFVLCLSVFLFNVTSPFWGALTTGLDHAFSGRELSRLFGRQVSSIETGLVNALWRLLAYGSLGLWGLHLSLKTGFKGILNDDIRRTKSILVTVLAGVVMGMFFIGYDAISANIFSRMLMTSHSLIPSAIFASIAEGIGCQILNMFFVVFFMWLFSKAVKTEEGRANLFWAVAILCSLIFAARHIESTRLWHSVYMCANIFQLSLESYLAIIGLYAPLSLVCTYFLRKYGLLSAITIHFICDIMWRVGWAHIRFGDAIFR